MNIFKNKKVRLFSMVALVLFVIFALCYWGNTSIQTSHINITNEKIPLSFNDYTIVQVSDLHNTEFGNNQSRLLKAIRKASPNIITVTGDLIDSNHNDISKAMDFINGALKIAPVYYVTGNHEAKSSLYSELKSNMLKAGVEILEDEGILLENSGESIELIGLNDTTFLTGANLANLVNNDKYTILLSHRPELFDYYVFNNVDLVLCGHAHGGQIRLPFIGGLYAPKQGFFPEYYEGVYEKNQTSMVVSRGLGNSIIPLRINNRPELVVITLKSDK